MAEVRYIIANLQRFHFTLNVAEDYALMSFGFFCSKFRNCTSSEICIQDCFQYTIIFLRSPGLMSFKRLHGRVVLRQVKGASISFDRPLCDYEIAGVG